MEAVFRAAFQVGSGARGGEASSPSVMKASRGCCTEASETMSRPNSAAVSQIASTLIFRSQVGTASTWYPRCISQAGNPLITRRWYWKIPRPRPSVATVPRLWWTYAFGSRPRKVAAMLSASSFPCRTACWAFITVAVPGRSALADQVAHHRLGLLNPGLYLMGALSQHVGSTGIVDVTSGNNSFAGVTGFDAGTGYDLASGWGTIDAAKFVPALARFG